MDKDSKRNNISKQINKEVLITIVLYLIYEWFFYSCVVGLILINILVYICVKFFFKDIDFDKYNENNESNKK